MASWSRVSAPRVTAHPMRFENLVKRLATDPKLERWLVLRPRRCHAGDDEYTHGDLKRYGIDEQLKDKFPDVTAREAEIRRRSEAWAKQFDATRW